MGQNDRFNSNTRFLGTYSSIPQAAVASALLIGDGAIVDLTGASSNHFVFAIQVIVATRFQIIECLDGVKGCISTVTAENDWDADPVIAAANNTTYTAGGSGVLFPVNSTIFGSWDKVELHEGTAIAYIADK